MTTIVERDLPLIGRKYEIDAVSGDRLTVVAHHDGRCDLYQRAAGDEERVVPVVTLLASEARQMAAILGGLLPEPIRRER